MVLGKHMINAGVQPPVPCPVCGSADTIDCGPPVYRKPTEVAGVPIDLSDLNLRHRRCQVCEYRFVFPPPLERLMDCYRRSARQWGTGAHVVEKRFYARKKALLEKYAPAKSALDFGCYEGGFLLYLGAEWRKAGIEPSSDAANVARAAGVEIIGPTLDTIDSTTYAGQFGAVIILDVMEHIPDPVGDLSKLREFLMPGGIVLIETGDAGSRDFVRFGHRHPYCGIAEHIGFFSRKSLQAAAGRAGFTLESFEPSMQWDYTDGAWRFPWYVRAYRLLRLLHAMHVPMTNRIRDLAEGPYPRAPNLYDHFLAVLRREE